MTKKSADEKEYITFKCICSRTFFSQWKLFKTYEYL